MQRRRVGEGSVLLYLAALFLLRNQVVYLVVDARLVLLLQLDLPLDLLLFRGVVRLEELRVVGEVHFDLRLVKLLVRLVYKAGIRVRH